MDVVYKRLNADITPEALAQLAERKIILESASQNKTKGRYSVVAFDIYGEVILTEDQLTIKTPEQTITETNQPYQKLKDYVQNYYAEIEEDLLKDLPFISGFIGSCSFDLVRHEFPVLKKRQVADKPNQTDVHLYMIENVYVFDHYKEYLYVISTNLFSNEPPEAIEQRVNQQIDALQNIKLYQPDTSFVPSQKDIIPNIPYNQFIQNISKFKQLITEGDMFQVVPSRIYRYKHEFGNKLHALSYQLYRKLKRQNPSPYMYYLNIDEPIIVGSSPESFVKVKGNEVVTNPIAGTIKRGQTPEEDEANAQQLLSDEKELSEHRMLVDLGRNDIHRVSKTGTSKIERLMEIEKYEHVMHIVSVVTGQLNEKMSPMDIIASLLPTGTVSGAPKLRAIERIYEAHPYKRGVYSGGVGYINCNHDLDFALAIRTMLIDDTYVDVEAGCGVVYDSIPEKELEETKLKAKSLLEVTP
ncbi:anthranilate synthase component I [Staphylococcus simulans]|uniref:anthranilate synthase component I n=1 Tax=Staphylococcus simulans TaxID=1286 RepID=UPI000D1EA74A|nr:anthranilate synthase component I [Staphylococcus simulans]MDY5061016.1 anthranilate synthase component I [Staphylococcus simulans]PTJ16377.1 anthranilate synthase component I [Staphylococcus simulans]